MFLALFKRNLTTIFLLAFLSLASHLCSEAQTYELNAIFLGAEDFRENKVRYKTSFQSPAQRQKEMAGILMHLHAMGYPAASLDSTVKDTLKLVAWYFLGEKYDLQELRPGNVDQTILQNAGYRRYNYSSARTFNYARISRLMKRILKYCENNGYPFARVKLDSVNIENGRISAALMLEKNQLVTIDSIIVKGDAKISMNYIRYYLGIRPGERYNESRISKIRQRLDELPFVSSVSPHEVAFTPESSAVYLYLGKKRASQFDGIIGIAPNNQTSGKLLLTGDVKLKLLNIIGRGELIDFNWRKLEESSQDLRLHFNYPYIFKTPFGFDYQFQLYKKDTSYIRLDNHIGIQYSFYGYNYIKAYYENQNSSLISTQDLEFATVLPPYADVNTNFYGLEANFERLDYRLNPRRGYSAWSTAAVGNKKIRKNQDINPALYDDIDLSGTQYRIRLKATAFVPVFRDITLKVSSDGGYLTTNSLFDNELFRFGGLKSLRGFDEESIIASLYNILTFEFRYIFETNSFFSLFWNGAYYEKESLSDRIIDRPYGFGVGLNFATRAGIFSVSYAIGKQFNNPIDLRSAKIHFGITATF